MIRQFLARCTVISLLAAPLAVVSASGAANAQSGDPVITIVGGGWGHGIGMSQYGAYGRAIEGHLYDQILDHYYPTTSLELLGNFAEFTTGVDDVDVRLDVRSTVAVSRPYNGESPEPGWEVAIAAGGLILGTSTTPVTASYSGGRWTATTGGDDLCAGDPRCDGVVLTITQTGGSHVVLEEFENGNNLGRYSHGSITLHPSSIPTSGAALPDRCGSGDQFCVIHADLDFQHYLYGLAEVPSNWPLEAMKAQAIAGRSYASAVMTSRAASATWNEPFDIYDSVEDQHYTGYDKESECLPPFEYGWCSAVNLTNDEVVAHAGAIATTFYSSSNGGYSASPVDVWSGGTAFEYLPARPDPFDANVANPNGSWTHTYTVADVSRWLNSYSAAQNDPIDQTHVGRVTGIRVEDLPASGRITFASVTVSGTEKTAEITRAGEPYGFRFYWALRQGCLGDIEAGLDCSPLIGTNFRVISFFDVGSGDYFFHPVLWMTTEALTTGTSPNSFSPDDTNTRAQLATFLWRFADRPSINLPGPFGDVAEGTWYERAVAWLASTGITTGTTAETFSPDDTVTRAQAAAFLWRFAGRPTTTVTDTFDDVKDGLYYTHAVRWMVQWGITTGTTPDTFSPDDPLTRGQIATFLWRLAGVPEAFSPDALLPSSIRP